MILTVDLGTSATKAMLWSPSGAVGTGRAELVTHHPAPGRAEQRPADWWASVVEAVGRCRTMVDRRAWREVECVSLASARESFVAVGADGSAVGDAILWSDRRAGGEAAALGHVDTGVIPDAGTMLAKLRWLATNDPARVEGATWFLSPRDFVVLHMTGVVATDPTMASRTGCYRVDGETVNDAAAEFATRLAPVRPSDDVVGALGSDAAGALALSLDTAVVLGAGDRACEVLGTGASEATPMVSWGTTANVSVPVVDAPSTAPAGFSISRGATGGFVVEAGLSAAGGAVEWLARLTGRSMAALADAAALSPPGARGVIALPWLNGARAPWWQPGSRATFANLTAAHDAGDLARAVWEAVAFDVARCIDALPGGVDGVVAAGGGVAGALWLEVLSAATARPVTLRRSGEAASVGACLLAAPAWSLDDINPVTARVVPDPDLAAAMRDRRPLLDRVAETVARLDLSEWNVP